MNLQTCEGFWRSICSPLLKCGLLNLANPISDLGPTLKVLQEPRTVASLTAGGKHMGMLSVRKREFRHTGGDALYLFMCFSIFATLNTAVPGTSSDRGLSPRAGCALHPCPRKGCCASRLDVPHHPSRCPTSNFLVTTLYKTLIYCAFSAPILFAERAWDFYEKPGPSAKPFVQAWEQMDRNRVWAKFIILGLVYGCYHHYHGIDRRLGEGKNWRADPQPRMRAMTATCSVPGVYPCC